MAFVAPMAQDRMGPLIGTEIDVSQREPAMKPIPRIGLAITVVGLAILLPSFATASSSTVMTCWFGDPAPLEQVVDWSDAIVVGFVRDADLRERKTIDVERWIVSAHSRSEVVQISSGYSSEARVGRRVLLFLRWPSIPIPTLVPSVYDAMKVIDLEDIHDVAWGLDELKSPWIANVTSTTSYALIDWDRHQIKVPERDPVLVEIESTLRDARARFRDR